MSCYINDDLLIEIFERLPPKSLVRFRCLSKLWYSRIASPDFIRRHRLGYSRQKVLITQWETSSLDMDRYSIDISDYREKYNVKNVYSLHYEDEFSLCHDPGYFDSTSTLEFPCQLSRVINSCNGIVCLFDCHESRITLWNPSIRRKLTLPDHPNSRPWSEFIVGFGFDPITDDYKVVRISYIICKFSAEICVQDSDVYSMKTRTWSSLDDPPKFACMDFRACLVNGALHWGAEVSLESEWECYIMSFNMSSHAFSKIELPEPKVSSKPTIIDGCLGVVSFEDAHCCRIWVMKECNSIASWYPHSRLSFESWEIDSVMQLPTNGYLLISDERHGLEVYNPVTKARFVLCGTQDNEVYMEKCLESLELLDSGELAS